LTNYAGDNGTVFRVNMDGTGFTNLHSFTPTLSLYGGTNTDGAHPYAGLVLCGDRLYGTTEWGGSSGEGTIFSINTDGTGFATFHSFTAVNNNTNTDGALPEAPLILSGDTLYGTTRNGGTAGLGTVFSIQLPPQLTITPAGANVILTWPTNFTGFTLQSTTKLGPPVVWTPVSPGPVIVNGQNTVTNPITGTQQFYRLSQ
jgi:uncharacterized repeat protein (TIGR03803 family)